MLSGYKTYIGAGLLAAAAFIRVIFPEADALAQALEKAATFFIIVGGAHKLAKITNGG